MENSLSTIPNDDNFLKLVEKVESSNDVDDVLKQLKMIRSVLDAANYFKQQSIRYAKLEAAALIRIVEIGQQSKLRGYRRHAAEWLHKMDSQSRKKYIQMCDNGMDITNIWKREVKEKQDCENEFKNAKEYEEMIMQTYEDKGVVEISYIQCASYNLFKYHPDLRNDFIDGIRRKLRQKGALGCGDGRYINPYRQTDAVEYAIITRVNSIFNDCQHLKAIAQKLDIKPLTEDKEWEIWKSDKQLYKYFMKIGVVENIYGSLEQSKEKLEKEANQAETSQADMNKTSAIEEQPENNSNNIIHAPKRTKFQRFLDIFRAA